MMNVYSYPLRTLVGKLAMKPNVLLIAVTLIASSVTLKAQSIMHPWHVIDRGGGNSTAGGITLQGSVGQPAIQMMMAAGANLESGYMPGLRYLSGTTSTLDVAFEGGWNMISVPFIMNDVRKSVLYPTGTSNAFLYQGSYVVRDSLKNSIGYWIKFSGPGLNHFTGTSIARDTIIVADKWNMVGCLSYPIRILDITPLDSVTPISNYWGYSTGSGYFIEDTLKPGKGYWIKVRHAGRLVLKTGSVMMEPSRTSQAKPLTAAQTDSKTDLTDLNKLLVRDAAGRERSLYFSCTKSNVEAEKWEIPPVPFDGVMDVRFATNRMLEVSEKSREKEVKIEISSAEYPLTISWEVKEFTEGAKLLAGKKEFLMNHTGDAVISSPGSPLKLFLAASSEKELPKAYILRQNFPNPFNPTTTIRYELPKDARVSIKIYDILGREVITLADEVQDAGFKSVVWSASAVASGVYMVRLEAKPADRSPAYVSTRKMIVLK